MKYARLVYGKNNEQFSKTQQVNLGDYFQTFAIENIYDQIGISKLQVETINRRTLYDYKGEKMILPMQGWFGYIRGIEIFPMPDNIMPIFMGYHCVTKKRYNKLCLEQYRQSEPVCCRDEKTYLLMKKNGIQAYLSGCFTITLPQREVEPKKQHVFMVDAPNGIEKFMPESLKKNMTYITQEVPIDYSCSEESEIIRLEKLSRSLLERYKNEATLIVTSRLHCAAPCLGMGIPVVLARKYFDHRYEWIDKFLPLYTPEEFENINWDVQKVDLSYIKPLLIDLARAMIFDSDNKEILMEKVHEYYKDRERAKISVPFYTRAYLRIQEINPRFADFMREVVLKKFSVATARDKSEI